MNPWPVSGLRRAGMDRTIPLQFVSIQTGMMYYGFMTQTTKDIPCPTCHAPAGRTCISSASGKPLSDLHRDRRLISCRQAAQLGIERLRKPIWANPLDHVKIDIINGGLGPWMHLFAPFNMECNGRDPVDILWPTQSERANPDAEELAVYDGPLPDSQEYREAVARYEGVLS